jgi:hypothetical protein
LLPDLVTGLNEPVRDNAGIIREWTAPNRETAIRVIRADLTVEQARLMWVVSKVEWDSMPASRRQPATKQTVRQKFYRRIA